MDIFTKPNPTKEEALLARVLKSLGKKKVGNDKVAKSLTESEDNL